MRRLSAAALVLFMAVSCAQQPTRITLTSAPDEARSKGSARFVIESTQVVAGIGAGGRKIETRMTGEGVSDFATNQALYTIRLETPKLLPGTQETNLECKLLLSRGVAYVQLPQTVAGKSWMRMGEIPASNASVDPTLILDSLKATGEEIQTLDRVKVRGVETTHYRTKMQISDFAGRMQTGERKEAIESMGDLGTEEVTVEAWIDEESLPRRIRWTTIGTGELSIDVKSTIEIFDYGVRVEVPDPKPEEIAEVQASGGSGFNPCSPKNPSP